MKWIISTWFDSIDCSHLSLVILTLELGLCFLEHYKIKPLHDNSKATKVANNVSSHNHLEIRNSNQYNNDKIKSQPNEDLVSKGGMDAMN